MMRKRWRMDIEARPTHLEHIGLQAGAHRVAGWSTYGCRPERLRLQAGAATVAGRSGYGCGPVRLRLRAGSPMVAGRRCPLGGVAQVVRIVLRTVTRHHEARREAAACTSVGYMCTCM